MEPKLREAGAQGRRAFEEGFSGGGGAEQLGNSFGDSFSRAFGQRFMAANIFGSGNAIGKLTQQVDSQLAASLRGQLPQAYAAATAATEKYEAAVRRATPAQQNYADLTQRISVLTAQHNELSAKASTILEQEGVSTGRYAETSRQANDVLTRRNQLETQLIGTSNAKREADEKLIPLQNKAAEAQANYTGKVTAYNEASQLAVGRSSMFAGMLGGAMVLGISAVASGMADLVEMGAHLFEDAVRGAGELTEKLVEVGEAYEQLNVQTVEFSGESGQALGELQEHVEKVFATLDVAGKDFGQTYSQLHTMLDMPVGPGLDDLARKLTDLQGRFQNLKAADVANIFRVFKVPADQMNQALDTLAQNAQHSGIGLGDLANAMKGDVAATMTEAGVSLGNAAYLTGKLEEAGLPAKQVMMGLNSAAKEVAKTLGTDYATGLREVVKELETASAPDRTAMLEKYFTGRKWAEVAAVLPYLSEALNGVANAHDGAAGAAQNEIQATENLGNKFEELKHKAEDAFKPFGELALKAIDGGLKHFSDWFANNKEQIGNDINHWGDTFIDMLPKLQHWAAIAIRLFGDVAEGIVTAFMPATTVLAVGGAAALAMTGHFKEAGELLGDVAKLDLAAITGKISGATDKMADAIENMDLHTGDMKENLAAAAGSMGDISNMTLPNLSGSAIAAPGMPSGPGSPTTIGPGPTAGGATPQGIPSTGGPPDTLGGAGAGYHGNVNWDDVARAEAGGNWQNADTGHNGHFGGLQFAPATWAAYGGTQFADRADHASREQQIEIANRVAFTGWNGTPPQGLGAWQTITDGQVQTTGANSGGTHQAVLADYTQSAGGSMPDYGASAGKPTIGPPDENSIRNWVQQQFGIPNTFGTGSWENAAHDADGGWHHNLTHDKSVPGYAFDFRGTDAQMDALANWVAQNYRGQTLELIHQGPGFDPNNEVKNGQFYNFGPDLNAQHGGASSPGGHVHWAMTVAPSGMAGGGMPGATPMGYGTPGYDQQRSRDRAVESANRRITELQREVQDKQDDITALQKEVDDESGKPAALRDPDLPKKQKQLQRMKEDLADLQNNQLPDANQDLSDAQSKASEPLKGSGGERSGEYDAASQLGSGLLSGIGQELGIDVLGKSPLEWGITKLLGGVVNWGLNGFGVGSGGGGGVGWGTGQGVGQSFGVQFPSPAAGNTPTSGMINPYGTNGNVSPYGPGGTGGPPAPTGPAPGPTSPSVHVAGDYAPIHVHAGASEEVTKALADHQQSWDHAQAIAATGLNGIGPVYV